MWQNGTTFYYFLEVAVIVIVMRLTGISFLWLDEIPRKPFEKGDRALVQYSVYLYFQ